MSKLYKFRVQGPVTFTVEVDETVEAESEEAAINIAIERVAPFGEGSADDADDLVVEGDDAWQAAARLRDGRALFGEGYRNGYRLRAAIDGDAAWICDGFAIWRAPRAHVEAVAPIDELICGEVDASWRRLFAAAETAEDHEHGLWIASAYKVFALALGGKLRSVRMRSGGTEYPAFAVEHESGLIGVVMPLTGPEVFP